MSAELSLGGERAAEPNNHGSATTYRGSGLRRLFLHRAGADQHWIDAKLDANLRHLPHRLPSQIRNANAAVACGQLHGGR